jgi:hypothetical protein
MSEYDPCSGVRQVPHRAVDNRGAIVEDDPSIKKGATPFAGTLIH